MLFNSFAFLLVFLPLALVTQATVEHAAKQWRRHSLLALSFVFYGYWDWRFVPLIAASIGCNWLIAQRLVQTRSKALLATAVMANLAALGFYKYLALLMQASNLLGLFTITPMSFALPLGISFFTFHHIMYLTDLRAGRAPRLGLVDYGLYIGFFPQVLAGPLVRWRELVPQLAQPCFRPGWEASFGRGLTLLAIGLCKKVLIGDALAGIAGPVFEAATIASPPTGTSWDGVLAFTLQIYFDFSGYTDMALGTALLFGIVLPQNFAVPYGATNIAAFWRRWHMTLSRFLRDFLYIPLGGNRHGLPVQVVALLVTMALGGLWHGAGLQFLLWGLLQGIGLVVHLLWRRAGGALPPWAGWALTLGFVILSWVLFRSPTLTTALRVYAGLLGAGPHDTPRHFAGFAAAAAVAMVGPTAWDAVHAVRPSAWLATTVALALSTVLLVLGDSASYEFIYFRF